MKSLTKHLIEESIINKNDSGYSGISKVLSNHKIKSIDFVFDVSGSTYGKNYNKWTDQADMIVNQAGQWGIRERDCNYWITSDGELEHIRLGQTINTPGGYTTNLDTIINELNPNPYSLVVIFTDDNIPLMKAIHTLRFRCPVVFVSDNTTLTGQDSLESRGIYFIHDNDIDAKRSIISVGGGRKSAMDSSDIELVRSMMEGGLVASEDGKFYVVSPESILFVYDENVYSPEVVADTVKYLERQGVKWKYHSDTEALRANRGCHLIPGR